VNYMQADMLFRLYSVSLLVFFAVGGYLFERKQEVFGLGFVALGFVVLSATADLTASSINYPPAQALSYISMAAVVFITLSIVWAKWGHPLFQAFILLLEFMHLYDLKRKVQDAAKNKGSHEKGNR